MWSAICLHRLCCGVALRWWELVSTHVAQSVLCECATARGCVCALRCGTWVFVGFVGSSCAFHRSVIYVPTSFPTPCPRGGAVAAFFLPSAAGVESQCIGLRIAGCWVLDPCLAQGGSSWCWPNTAACTQEPWMEGKNPVTVCDNPRKARSLGTLLLFLCSRFAGQTLADTRSRTTSQIISSTKWVWQTTTTRQPARKALMTRASVMSSTGGFRSE